MTAEWLPRELRDVADIRVSNVDKKIHPAEIPVNLCNYMDAYSNIYITRQIEFMRGSASRAEVDRFGLRRGDVILTKDSETPNDIGIPALVADDIDHLVCGYHLALIRPHTQEVNPIYLAKQLATSRVARYFALHASGSTRYGLPVAAIEAVPIPIPPIPEQEKIAEILSTVDRADEQASALIAKQLRLNTGLLHDLLTRGVDEHGEIRSAGMHDFKDSVIGRVPREWTIQTLGDLLRQAGGFLQTGPFGSQLHAHEYVPEGVPVVMPQDIIRGRVATTQIVRIPEARANDLRRHRLQPNDIVFSRRGDLSRAAAISSREEGWICGTGCFLLRAPADRLECRWLADVYRHGHTQRQVETNAVGSTMLSLNNAVMSQVTIAVPSVEEQREIARRRQAADAALSAMVREKEKLVSLKVGLMQDFLTGRVRVTPLPSEADAALERVS